MPHYCEAAEELIITLSLYPHNPSPPALSCIHTQFKPVLQTGISGPTSNLNLPDREKNIPAHMSAAAAADCFFL